MPYPVDHPPWCRCRRCEAADREQERAALGGDYVEPVEAAEFEPPALPAPPHDPDPYDWRREQQEKLDRERERY